MEYQRFGKHVLLERIATGGMAEIFRAKSFGVEGFEKIVAIKRILPQTANDRDFIKMFINEAKILSALSHSSICQIFELGEIEGSFFISMELISGKSLQTILQLFRKHGRTMPLTMAAFIMSRVCEGLDYVYHKVGLGGRPLHVVHLDISPHNILVSYEGAVKLIDFGIARGKSPAGQAPDTQSRQLQGKFDYMAPEQIAGEAVDHRSDVFSTGVCLYELATNRHPFTGSTEFNTLENIRKLVPPPPSSVNPDVTPDLDSIILKAIEKLPSRRWERTADMMESLQRFIVSKPPLFNATSLAQFAKRTFARDIDEERRKNEIFSNVKFDDDAPTEPPTVPGIPSAMLAEMAAAMPGAGVKVDDAPTESQPPGRMPPVGRPSPKRTLFGMPSMQAPGALQPDGVPVRPQQQAAARPPAAPQPSVTPRPAPRMPARTPPMGPRPGGPAAPIARVAVPQASPRTVTGEMPVMAARAPAPSRPSAPPGPPTQRGLPAQPAAPPRPPPRMPQPRPMAAPAPAQTEAPPAQPQPSRLPDTGDAKVIVVPARAQFSGSQTADQDLDFDDDEAPTAILSGEMAGVARSLSGPVAAAKSAAPPPLPMQIEEGAGLVLKTDGLRADGAASDVYEVEAVPRKAGRVLPARTAPARRVSPALIAAIVVGLVGATVGAYFAFRGGGRAGPTAGTDTDAQVAAVTPPAQDASPGTAADTASPAPEPGAPDSGAAAESAPVQPEDVTDAAPAEQEAESSPVADPEQTSPPPVEDDGGQPVEPPDTGPVAAPDVAGEKDDAAAEPEERDVRGRRDARRDRDAGRVTHAGTEDTGPPPPPRDAGRPVQDTAAAGGDTGKLNVISNPWSYVSIDGSSTGRRTPLVNYQLPVGIHQICLEAEDGTRFCTSVRIVPDRPARVSHEF